MKCQRLMLNLCSSPGGSKKCFKKGSLWGGWPKWSVVNDLYSALPALVASSALLPLVFREYSHRSVALSLCTCWITAQSLEVIWRCFLFSHKSCKIWRYAITYSGDWTFGAQTTQVMLCKLTNKRTFFLYSSPTGSWLHATPTVGYCTEDLQYLLY